MQIVSSGDNLHEKSKPIFWEKKGKMSPFWHLLNFAQRMVKVMIFVHDILKCFSYFSPENILFTPSIWTDKPELTI